MHADFIGKVSQIIMKYSLAHAKCTQSINALCRRDTVFDAMQETSGLAPYLPRKKHLEICRCSRASLRANEPRARHEVVADIGKARAAPRGCLRRIIITLS